MDWSRCVSIWTKSNTPVKCHSQNVNGMQVCIAPFWKHVEPCKTARVICKTYGAMQDCIAPFWKHVEPCKAARVICKTYGAMQDCIAPFGKNMAPCKVARVICKTYGAMQGCIAPHEIKMAPCKSATIAESRFPHLTLLFRFPRNREKAPTARILQRLREE
jgi:hypothetical protein